MTVVIPQFGETNKTQGLRLAKAVLSGDTTGDTYMYDDIIGSGDSAAVVALFTFPNDAFIYDVGWRVVTPFTAALTLTLGDTDSAAGWAGAVAMGATVADTEINWGRGLVLLQTQAASTTLIADTTLVPLYPIHGRTMVADTVGDPINLNATVAGTMAAVDTGVLEVYALYFMPFGKSST